MLPLISLVSASFWGGLADATQRHGRLLTLAIGGTLLSVLALSLATTFYWLIAVAGLVFFVLAGRNRH